MAVLRQILRQITPFTANSIYQLVLQQVPIDLATVYRIINLFVTKGILREVVYAVGFQYYELACDHHPEHAHFICNNCHKIDCLEGIGREQLGLFSKYQQQFTIQAININLTGVCNKCLDAG